MYAHAISDHPLWRCGNNGTGCWQWNRTAPVPRLLLQGDAGGNDANMACHRRDGRVRAARGLQLGGGTRHRRGQLPAFGHDFSRRIAGKGAGARLAAGQRAKPATGHQDGTPGQAATAAEQPAATCAGRWVRAQRTLEAPAQPASAWAGLLAHTSLRQIGTITPGATGSTILPAPEPGIDVAEFGVTLVQLSSKTILIAADADAAWLPARTPAEHLDPAAFGSVTISAQRWTQTRVVTRTFTAQAGISRLTAIINAGTPAPTGVVAGMHCAPVATVYILRFTPRAAGGPSVVVTLGACPHAYDITVNGKLGDVGPFGSACAPFDPSGGGDLRQDMRLTLPLARLEDRRRLLAQLDQVKRGLADADDLDAMDRTRAAGVRRHPGRRRRRLRPVEGGPRRRGRATTPRRWSGRRTSTRSGRTTRTTSITPSRWASCCCWPAGCASAAAAS